MAAAHDESLTTLQQLPKSLPYFLPSHFYEDIPETPIPNPTPAENAFLYHDIGEQIGKTWRILHNIVIRHEPAIVAAWEKKSTKRRLAIISAAWGHEVPEIQRPDRACFITVVRDAGGPMNFTPEDTLFGKSSKRGTAFTYPYINETFLTSTKKALLMMINSRARGGPDLFYKFNIQATHVGRSINALLIPNLQGFRIDNSNEMNYGSIIPSTSTFHQYGLTAGETLMAMKIHDRVMKFLIRCCQLILNQNDLQVLTSPSTPVLPEARIPFFLRQSRWSDVANTIWEGPLVMPTPKYNSNTIMDYMAVRKGAAEDHIWDLRENPGYFATTVLEWSEHQRERICFPDEPDILETGTPKFWNRVIREVIAHAFETLVAWTILNEQYLHIHYREKKNSNALSWISGISPDCADEMHIFQYLTSGIATEQIRYLWGALLVSPYYRKTWREYLGPQESPIKKGDKPNLDRDIPTPPIGALAKTMMNPRVEPNFMMLTRLLSTHSLMSFGYTNMVEDMGYGLAFHPMENIRMSACSQKLFSDLGLIASFKKEVEKHQTFCMKRPFLTGKDDVEIAKIATEKLAPYAKTKKTFRHYTRLATLGTPIKGRFDYPANEKRTLEVTKRMQESEKNLEEFWKKADEEHKEKTGMYPLDEMRELLTFDSSLILKTPDWVESEKKDFVDKELLIKELCEEKLPRKKRKSKNPKAIPKGEFDGNLGVTERFSAGCESSQGNENDLVDDNAKTSDSDSKPIERTSDLECVHDSEKIPNGRAEGHAAQPLPELDNDEPKMLKMETETAPMDTTAPEAKVELTVGADNNKREGTEAAVEMAFDDQKECEIETETTTTDTSSQFKALDSAYEDEAKTHGVEVESTKQPESRTSRKWNMGLGHSRYSGDIPANDSLDSPNEQENRVETKSSVNTAREAEHETFECIVETFHPGCASMMSGAIYDDAPLTSESFSEIPDSEFRREVCPRRPALEALISNKPPLDQPWTQVGKKPDDEAGTDCTHAVGPPGGNIENQLPLNFRSFQIPDSEYKRRAWWARQRRQSPDIPIQDESQRGRPRLQAGDEPNDDVDTEITLARGFFEENEHTDPEHWWSKRVAAHHASDAWAKYESSPWPKFGRARLDSERFPNDKVIAYWYSIFDRKVFHGIGRRESESGAIKKSRFMPESPLDSYDPLEAAAERYAQTQHLEDYGDARWDDAIGDSGWHEAPTWRHIEYKQVEDDGDVSWLDSASTDAGVNEGSPVPKSEPTSQDDSSRSQSLSGESQKSNGILDEESAPTAFSTNTTVSPENPKLALAASVPAVQEEAILAYEEANKSLENFAAAQSELDLEAIPDIIFPIQKIATPSGDGHIYVIHLSGGKPPINFLVTTQDTPELGTAYWEAIRADIATVSWAWRWRHCNVDDLKEELAGLTDEETYAFIISEAENQDTFLDMEDFAKGNLMASETADFEIREDSNISAGVSGAPGSCVEMQFLQSGLIASEAESQDVIQGADESATGELVQVDDRKLARRQVFVAIPWNLIGVRRGVKIPEIKWPAIPKPPSEQTAPEESRRDQSPEQNENSEAELIQAIRPSSEELEQLEPKGLQRDQRLEQNESSGAEILQAERSPGEEPESGELQQDQSPEQNPNPEVQAVRSPSQEPEPKEAQQGQSPEQNQGSEAGLLKAIRSRVREAVEQNRSEAEILQTIRSRVGTAVTAYQQSSENTGPKKSQEDHSPERNQGSRVLRSRESEEWQAIRSKVEKAIKAQRSHREELGSSPIASKSEDVSSNASTETLGAESFQGTSIDTKEATFAFTIPQDPHGYLNAYSKNPLFDSLEVDPKPEPKEESLGVFEALREFATKIGGLEALKEYASEHDTLEGLPYDEKYHNLNKKPKPKPEPEPDHDIYYVSKTSYKVFSAIFHDPMDKQPPPSFIWSEFVAAMQEIEFMPMHEYATLWHFALKEEGVGMQIHQPHYQGVKKEGALGVKVSAEYARWIGRRLERNYGYGKAWFLVKSEEE